MPRFPATGRMAAHPSIAVDIEDGGTSQKSDHALFLLLRAYAAADNTRFCYRWDI